MFTQAGLECDVGCRCWSGMQANRGSAADLSESARALMPNFPGVALLASERG